MTPLMTWVAILTAVPVLIVVAILLCALIDGGRRLRLQDDELSEAGLQQVRLQQVRLRHHHDDNWQPGDFDDAA